jgi:hypothetical protein
VSSLPLDHSRKKRFHRPEESESIDRKGSLYLLVRDLEKALAAHDAGVVNKDVDRAGNPPRRFVHVFALRHIDRVVMRPRPESFDLSNHVLETLLVQIPKDERRFLSGGSQGEAASEAARGTGDKHLRCFQGRHLHSLTMGYDRVILQL